MSIHVPALHNSWFIYWVFHPGTLICLLIDDIVQDLGRKCSAWKVFRLSFLVPYPTPYAIGLVCSNYVGLGMGG